MKKNSLLVIFTYKYPYEPPVEQFLDDEMHYIAVKDVDILIIPVSRKLMDEKYSILNDYDNVKTYRIKRNNIVIETIIGFWHSLKFIRFATRDLWRIVNNVQKVYKVHALKETIKQYIQGGALFSAFINQIPKDYFRGREKIILYSYWLNASVVAESLYKRFLLKKYNINVLAFARAHGDGDLYQNGFENYRPCIDLINDQIDVVFPISQNGQATLSSQGIVRTEISCLGVAKRTGLTISDNDIPLIVSCSVINDNKRVERIAEILGYLNRSIRWVHFGGGPKEQELIRYCNVSLPCNVKWELRGWTDHKDIMSFYQEETPDMFINVSRIEGIPVSIMEAMSFSIPCLATKVGATDEIVIDGFNGYLINVDFKAEDIAKKLDEYFNDGIKQMIKMRKNAYSMFLNKYNSQANYTHFANRVVSQSRCDYE